MSVLADFDWLLEMSRPALERLIQARFSPPGTDPDETDPPFEVNQPGLYMIVYPPTLTLSPQTSNIILTLRFEEMTLSVDPFEVGPLYGTITVTAALSFHDEHPTPATTTRFITLDLPNAQAHVNFDADSQAKLAGFPTYQADADARATTYVRSVPQPLLPERGFDIDSRRDGSIRPPQRFTRLDTALCIDADTVGWFADLLSDRAGAGDPRQKTGRATADGENISVSLSANAFRRLIYCRSAAIQFRAGDLLTPFAVMAGLTDQQAVDQAAAEFEADPPAALASIPSACGTAPSRNRDGVDITHLSCDFAEGHINVGGSFHKSGFCYEASGTFHQQLTLAIGNNNAITATFSPNPPKVDINSDIDFACHAAIVAIGVLAGGWTFAYFTQDIGLMIASGLIGGPEITAAALKPGLENDARDQVKKTNAPNQNAGMDDFGHVALKNPVRITPEALTFGGNLDLPLPAWEQPPRVNLTSTTSLLEPRHKVSQGTYHFKGTATCPPGDFKFTEFEDSLIATVTARPTLLGKHPAWEWWIESWRGYYLTNSQPVLLDRKPLTTPGRQVQLSVDARFRLPMPDGTTVNDSLVTLHYALTGNQVTLRNVASQGNFGITVVARATGGKPERNAQSAIGLTFTGNAVEFGKDYDDHMFRCQINKIKAAAKTVSTDLWDVFRNPPPDPRVQPVADLIRLTSLTSRTELTEVLGHLRVLHGDDVVNAALTQAFNAG
ncbi:hypothetical protein [Mycolicibacterium llatzerense]|uniref:hypothetical protein n=1 Tax=Mycolicibacterium llatzerense TaxID=280871 RepID=UPI0013A6CE55|nr:hypothetical protein [Mycolicibacterium llatzerense]